MRFQFINVNWNLARKFIRTSLYQDSMRFLLPFVKSKRICQAEDLLHCGVVFLFAKNFYCAFLPIYIDYLALSDSSGTYKSEMQHKSQLFYVKSLLIYFYKYKNNYYNITFESYLNDNRTNIELFKNVSDVNTTNKINNCNINITRFQIIQKEGYCVITQNNI